MPKPTLKIEIEGRSISFEQSNRLTTVVAVVFGAFSLGLASLFLWPLLSGQTKTMPITFFVGMGGSSLLFFYFCARSLVVRRIRTRVDLGRSRVIVDEEVLGRPRTETHPIAEGSRAVARKTRSRELKSGNQVRELTDHQLELHTGGQKFLLRGSTEPDELEHVRSFFSAQKLPFVVEEYGVNRVGVILTLLFVAALLIELRLMGKI